MKLGRGVPLALTILLLTGSCSGGGAPAPGGAESSPKRECDDYTLIGRMRAPVVEARVRPNPEADVVATFTRVNAQGAHQVFPLVDETFLEDEVWFRAMLPIRPNGSTGWIPASAVQLRRSDYRLEIDLGRLSLRLFDRCDRVGSYPIGIGTEDTPTPKGTFFLNSLLKPPQRGTVYGAFAFGLSAYSDVITDWEGGGIVGLHGTNDPSSIGKRRSKGCIRMPNAAIRELAKTVPLGTIVKIG